MTDSSNLLIAGIDGGGSSVRVVLCDAQGNVLGLGASGPANIHDLPEQTVQDHIGLARDQAFEKAGLAVRPVDSAFFGMCAVVTDTDRAAIRRIALALDFAPAQRVGVHHDICIALAGGLAGQPGIALIVGTGSSCFGRNSQGKETKVGGWGHLLGDEGSSYFLGMQAMIAVIRSYEGRGGPTLLTDEVMKALKIDALEEITRKLYIENMSRAEIAALARRVMHAVEQGDPAATDIVSHGVEDLAELVWAASQNLKMAPEEALITTIGGLAHSGPAYQQPLYEAIQRRLPGCTIIEPVLPPVLGAVLLAMEQIGLERSLPVVEQMKATMPEGL